MTSLSRRIDSGMNSRIITLTLAGFLLISCNPQPSKIVLHNSCSGYTRLRGISFPTEYTKKILDSLGFTSIAGENGPTSYLVDTRVEIHPEDRFWLKGLRAVFPDAQFVDGEKKGETHVWVGASGLAFDSLPFSRKLLVLNGTSKAGLARDVAYRFNVRFGLSSLEPQTADRDTFSKTILYCSPDDTMLARNLVGYLGAGSVNSRSRLGDMILVLGSDVLTPQAKLKPPPSGVSIVIKKSLFQLLVFDEGKLVKTYPVALGKNAGDKQRVGDCRTPEGEFTVTAIKDSHTWEHDFADDTLGSIQGAYGPWFLALSTLASETRSGKAWQGIAIHGTHDPASIGTRASEGCIRMHNEDVDSLKRMVGIGTPVRIEE